MDATYSQHVIHQWDRFQFRLALRELLEQEEDTKKKKKGDWDADDDDDGGIVFGRSGRGGYDDKALFVREQDIRVKRGLNERGMIENRITHTFTHTSPRSPLLSGIV